MLLKLGSIALRIFWEAFALGVGFLAGAVPALLIAGGIAWTVVDPGCSCFSQKVILAKVQIEQNRQLICGAAALIGFVSYLLMRRFKFALRDLVDLAVAIIVFGGVYFLFSSVFKDLPSLTMFFKVPLNILVPMILQSGLAVPGVENPVFPWKEAFGFCNSWAFLVSATSALVMFFGFGETFRMVPKMLAPRLPVASTSAVDLPAAEG